MAHCNSWDKREVQRTRELIQDGRLVDVSDNYITQLKNCSELTDRGGGFGVIYISRDPVPGFKHRLVLKEICVNDEKSKSQTQLLGSVKNEKLASRVRHFGIVPVLAFHDDISNGNYYLISPYFENGDLHVAIKSDREKLNKGEKVLLDWKTRLKVIYQIACAIDYMHTPNSFRGTILHLDIKPPNIVLDKRLNARLIDFGLSRESMTGSFKTTTCAPIQRTKSRQSDYYDFGVVMRAILTGLDFNWSDERQTPLSELDIRTLDTLLEKRIWNLSDVLAAVFKIARQCMESEQNRDNMKSTSMRNDLKSILDKHASDQKWTNLDDNQCEICVVNDQLEEPLKSEESSHRRIYDINHDGCPNKIKICCACMRNSYINPVRCQECDNEIKAIIGDGWGAILIVGYDKKNQALFHNDVKKFAEAISSKVLPSMCVSTVIIIDSAANETKSVSNKIDDAFDSIDRHNIHTLVFLYSGHHGNEGFLVGDNQYVSIDKFNCCIQKCTKVKRVIAFMDCCEPEQISVGKEQCLIQFNATNSKENAIAITSAGSLFTKLLVQAFTMKASGGQCTVSGCTCSIGGYFITNDSLWKYIEDHRRKGTLLEMTPERTMIKINWQNEYLAYNYTFIVEFRFDIVLPQPFKAKKIRKVLPTDLTDFKHLIPEILFPEFVSLFGTHLKARPKAMSHTLTCADCLCIVYDTHPKRCEEIDNMEKLLLAWNSMRLLYCKLRDFVTRDLRKPAGFFVQNGKRVEECMRDLHYSKKLYDATEFEELINNLLEREKTESDTETETALKTFIDTVYKYSIREELQVNNQILEIQFLDLFEEGSDCVVYMLLIEPDISSSANASVGNSSQGDPIFIRGDFRRRPVQSLRGTSKKAAFNSQNEERDRLRRELKFAHEELILLRRIQRIQMEAERPGGMEPTLDIVLAPPASLVLDTSSVLESEESKTDSEQTDDQETVYAEVSEDNMPGLPIEPEVTSELTTLNETSPGALDSLVDAESSLDLEEPGLTEDYMFDETESEQFDEELREVEPPEEDQLEDSDTQEVEFEGDSDNASDTDGDNDGDEEETDDKLKSDEDVNEEEFNVDGGKADGTFDDSKHEDALNERLQGDFVPGENCESELESDRRSSGEVYQDALDDNGKEEDEKNVELTEDPGGTSVDPVNSNGDKDDLNDNLIGDTKDNVGNKFKENNSGDILNNDKDCTDLDNPSNNNINKTAEINQQLGTSPSADANEANSEKVTN